MLMVDFPINFFRVRVSDTPFHFCLFAALLAPLPFTVLIANAMLSSSQPTMLKKTLQCLEGIHLSQSGSLLMLYVDKLLSTPFRVLARMVDTLACRRVEMLLAETKQVHLMNDFLFYLSKGVGTS